MHINVHLLFDDKFLILSSILIHTGIKGDAGACICKNGYEGTIVYSGTTVSGCNQCPIGKWSWEGEPCYLDLIEDVCAAMEEEYGISG
jgi:hypothetical protein